MLVLASVLLSAQQPAPSQFSERIAKANTLREHGKPQEAEQAYQDILPALRAEGPSAELAEVLSNLSDIANAAGDYKRAVQLAQESGRIYQQLHDAAHEAGAHNDAGMALLNASQYADAANELETALRLNQGTRDAETTTLILNNLGNVYYYEARYSEAFRSYETALRYAEQAAAETWASGLRQLALLNIATLYQKLGSDQKAIDTYAEITESPEVTPDELGRTVTNLGVLYRHMGDPEMALSTYQRARKYYAKVKDPDAEMNTLLNTGIVLGLDLGRLQDALRMFDAAHELAVEIHSRREEMHSILYRGEVLLRMGRLAEAESEFTSSLKMAEELGTAEEQWKALYGLGRIALQNRQVDAAAAKFRDAIHRIEGVRSKLQLSRLKSDFFGDKRNVYDALIALLLQRNDAAAAFEYMERSRARVFQDRFFRDRPALETTSIASIQNHLDDHTALVEYWTGPDAVAAVWMTRHASGIAQSQLSPAQMQELIHFVTGLPDNLNPQWQQDFQKLASLLPAGIPALNDRNFQRLIIVPDEFLSLLPFELFPTAAGMPLVEEHDVTYMPSAVLLLRTNTQRFASLRFPWQQQLLAFGDPQAGDVPGNTLFALPERQTMEALPSSGEEIREIAAMSAGRKQVFLGNDDRKQNFFKATSSRPALLHVSTHAIADLDNPELSRLLFSPDSNGEPNNYVFLEELYDLDLRGISLATLSACDTERGRLVPGEGVQAFSRALLSAGSRATLTTLWRVPDQPTEEFMKQFYFFLLKQHQSKAKALRLAKLKFLHSGTELSHPKYWAAFVLNGDGEEPAPRFIPWPAFIMLGGVLVVMAVVAVGWVKTNYRKKQFSRELTRVDAN
jgi:CHAT domain-containing protein/predicted negative regulator of RcsB-dependent stress response